MNVIISNKYQSMLESLNIDVIKNLNGEFDVDDIIRSFDNFYFQRMILDITAIKDYKDIKNIQKLSISLDMNKVILLLDDSPECTSPEFLSKLVSIGIYNFTTNTEGIMYLYNTPNSYRDVAHIQQLEIPQVQQQQHSVAAPSARTEEVFSGPRIIGVKDVTKEAGATSFVYMMKKELSKNYDVVAIEVDKRDFIFLKDKDLLSSTSLEVGNLIANNSRKDVIILDLNTSKTVEAVCQKVIYLVEPSTIKINRMMLGGAKILEDLKDKMVVLNKSMLSDGDVRDFEYESNLSIAYNMPPLNDRADDNSALNKFLVKLGYTRQKVNEK